MQPESAPRTRQEDVVIQLHRRTVALTAVAFAATLAVAVIALVVALTGRAEANDRFDDLPARASFHETAGWLAANGVADGFPDGTFRPDGDITRGQASSWLANYNETIALVARTQNPAGNSAFTGFATCPTGRRPVAGGGETDVPELFMTDSRPSGPTEWSVSWETQRDILVNPAEISVWALCVPDTIP